MPALGEAIKSHDSKPAFVKTTAGIFLSKLERKMVEVAGIEPASSRHSRNASTGIGSI
jgi:hypothetical protein